MLLAALGAAGCSKRDRNKTTTPKATASVNKPVEAPPKSPASGAGDEGLVAPVMPPPTVLSSFEDGERAYQAKKYGDAVAIFEAYTERRPGNGWGHYMLGLSAWKHGEFSKSEKAFDKALSIDPNHVKSLVNSSRLFIDQKRHDEAINRLTLASEIAPDSGEVLRLLAKTHADLGHTDEAVEAYRRVIDLNDSDAWSMNHLGLLLIATERAGEAVPLLQRAVEVRMHVAEFHNTLGLAFEHTGSFRAAAEAYGDALLVDPRFEQAKQNLQRVEAVKSGTEVK
jgi:tetratricopeptide (TPR) repeat protein